MVTMLTENQLANDLQLSRWTLWYLRKHGLPYFRLGRSVRYRLDDVERWLKGCKTVAAEGGSAKDGGKRV